jgi:GxxExxY protein
MIVELKHKEITDKILKAFYDVYNELGSGFLESVYEKAISIVLSESGLNIKNQENLKVYFRDQEVGSFYSDLIVEDKVIVELKAVKKLHSEHEAQLLNYLKATKIEVGLLLNFGEKPEFIRRIFDNERK